MGRTERYRLAEAEVLREIASLKPNEHQKREQLYSQLRGIKQSEKTELRNKKLPPPRVTKEKKLSRFAQSQKERRQRNMEALGPIGPRAVAWSSLTAPKQQKPPVERGEAMATDTPPAYPAPLSEPVRPLPEPPEKAPEPEAGPGQSRYSKAREKAKKRKMIEEALIKVMSKPAEKKPEEDEFEDY